jgi:hypothetical protein
MTHLTLTLRYSPRLRPPPASQKQWKDIKDLPCYNQ